MNKSGPQFPGFLTGVVYAALQVWIQYCSPFAHAAYAPLSKDDLPKRLNLRDTSVVLWLAGAVLAFVAWPNPDAYSDCGRCHTVGLSVVAAIASWRLFDLAVLTLSFLVFGTLRHRGRLLTAPKEESQRTLLTVMLHYVEIMFWFSLFYLWIGADKSQFENPALNHKSAFFMSLSTMTTVGYGTYAPQGEVALAFAAIQALLAIGLVSGVVAIIVSRLTAKPTSEENQDHGSSDEYPEPLTGWRRKARHVTPFLALTVIWGILFQLVFR